ncbi:MAG: hypothetical protein ACYC35_19705 [Pirellulales bacterium]
MVSLDDLQRAHDAAISLLDRTQTVVGASAMTYTLDPVTWHLDCKALPGRLAQAEAIIGPVLGLHAAEHSEPVTCCGVAGESAHEVVLGLARLPVGVMTEAARLGEVWAKTHGEKMDVDTLTHDAALRSLFSMARVGHYDPGEWNSLRVRLAQEAKAAADKLTTPPAADGPEAKVVNPKKSTSAGSARAKIIAVLIEYHRYAKAGGCLNDEPIVSAELARRADVSPGSVSAFFKKAFRGRAAYERACRTRKLEASLKLLNGDMPPYILIEPAKLDGIGADAQENDGLENGGQDDE